MGAEALTDSVWMVTPFAFSKEPKVVVLGRSGKDSGVTSCAIVAASTAALSSCLDFDMATAATAAPAAIVALAMRALLGVESAMVEVR